MTTVEYRVEVKTHVPLARWEAYPGTFKTRKEALTEAYKAKRGAWSHWRVVEVTISETVVDTSED